LTFSGHRPAQRPVPPHRHERQFLRGADRGELAASPARHRSVLDLERIELRVDEFGVRTAARAGVEPVDRSDLVGRQREVEDVEVLLDAVRLDRLRNRGDAVVECIGGTLGSPRAARGLPG
jgi:hypothetical protein